MGILLPPPPGSKTAQQTVPTVNTASNIFTSFESSTHSPFQSVTSTNATKTADNLLLDFDWHLDIRKKNKICNFFFFFFEWKYIIFEKQEDPANQSRIKYLYKKLKYYTKNHKIIFTNKKKYLKRKRNIISKSKKFKSQLKKKVV